jgi:Sas10 C-terminal domain
MLPPRADAIATGQRKITSAIEKNRGLTPHRCSSMPPLPLLYVRLQSCTCCPLPLLYVKLQYCPCCPLPLLCVPMLSSSLAASTTLAHAGMHTHTHQLIILSIWHQRILQKRSVHIGTHSKNIVVVCRRKDIKNPRVKGRVKFAAAVIKRKGQVQSIKTNTGSAYGGEETGIKSKLSKSRRLG